jgi:hypothetical protein
MVEGGAHMAITCPNCSRQFDITLFQFGKAIRCECGSWIDPLDWWLGSGSEGAVEREEEKLQELRRLADRICFYIVSTDFHEADIVIEASKARKRCEQLFPGKGHLFDMVYGSRFRRLWSQFREGSLDLS